MGDNSSAVAMSRDGGVEGAVASAGGMGATSLSSVATGRGSGITAASSAAETGAELG